MDDLRTDVGSILWTSRKMRGYSVKPIDKVLPRKVGELMGRGGGGPGGGANKNYKKTEKWPTMVLSKFNITLSPGRSIPIIDKAFLRDVYPV